MTPHPPFVFGYFPRHKYKDLVFYVRLGKHTEDGLQGLFEMEDTPENRILMDVLASHTPDKSEQDIEQLKLAIVEVLDTGFESSERDMVLVLDRIDAWAKGELRKQEIPPCMDKPKFNSTELLLLANDEWKRREERKHNHNSQAWQAGFINGFLTDWKWARNWIDKIQREAELRKQDGEQE